MTRVKLLLVCCLDVKKEIARVAPTMQQAQVETSWKRNCSQLYGGKWLEPSLKHTLFSIHETLLERKTERRQRFGDGSGRELHVPGCGAMQVELHIWVLARSASRNAWTWSVNVFYAFALQVRKCAFLACNYRTCRVHDFDSHHLHFAKRKCQNYVKVATPPRFGSNLKTFPKRALFSWQPSVKMICLSGRSLRAIRTTDTSIQKLGTAC